MKKIYTLITLLAISFSSYSQCFLNATHTNVLCNGQCTGTGTANIFGGTPPYTFLWSPGGHGSLVPHVPRPEVWLGCLGAAYVFQRRKRHEQHFVESVLGVGDLFRGHGRHQPGHQTETGCGIGRTCEGPDEKGPPGAPAAPLKAGVLGRRFLHRADRFEYLFLVGR